MIPRSLSETSNGPDKKMRRATIYLKSGQQFDLYGRGFSVKFGRLEGDLREIAWEELDADKADPLWLDPTSVSAVVIHDE